MGFQGLGGAGGGIGLPQGGFGFQGVGPFQNDPKELARLFEALNSRNQGIRNDQGEAGWAQQFGPLGGVAREGFNNLQQGFRDLFSGWQGVQDSVNIQFPYVADLNKNIYNIDANERMFGANLDFERDRIGLQSDADFRLLSENLGFRRDLPGIQSEAQLPLVQQQGLNATDLQELFNALGLGVSQDQLAGVGLQTEAAKDIAREETTRAVDVVKEFNIADALASIAGLFGQSGGGGAPSGFLGGGGLGVGFSPTQSSTAPHRPWMNPALEGLFA